MRTDQGGVALGVDGRQNVLPVADALRLVKDVDDPKPRATSERLRRGPLNRGIRAARAVGSDDDQFPCRGHERLHQSHYSFHHRVQIGWRPGSLALFMDRGSVDRVDRRGGDFRLPHGGPSPLMDDTLNAHDQEEPLEGGTMPHSAPGPAIAVPFSSWSSYS